MTDVSQTGFATASVVGTGMMGPGIALTLALGGIRATLLSRTADRAAQGVAKARAQGRVARMDALARPDALLASNTSGLRELRTPGRGRGSIWGCARRSMWRKTFTMNRGRRNTSAIWVKGEAGKAPGEAPKAPAH